MPEKKKKSDEKTISSENTYLTDYEDLTVHRYGVLTVKMSGEPPENMPHTLIAYFNGTQFLDGIWLSEPKTVIFPIDFNTTNDQKLLLPNPLIFLIRIILGKPSKVDPDPMLNGDNRAMATIDLLPLIIGSEEIYTTVRPTVMGTSHFYGTCEISVLIACPGKTDHDLIPFLVTMESCHCMPPMKDGTVFLSAMGLNDLYDPIPLNFGMSISTPDAKHLCWGSTNYTGVFAAETAYNCIKSDRLVPEDLYLKTTTNCQSFYWNSINRALVDKQQLIERLSVPFFFEVAAVPKVGKLEVRGRFMGWADASALLQPGQTNITVCAKIVVYNEARVSHMKPLLTLPPMSAKANSARDTDLIFDEFGHSSYLVFRFDLMEPLIPETPILSLYEIIGFPPIDDTTAPVDELIMHFKPEPPMIDAKFIRRSGAALAVHEELSNLAWRGSVPMDQSIKRSAANILLMRVRAALKNFPPGDCSYIEWQDTVTEQHASARRAVTASFAPQPPPVSLPNQMSAARCRVTGDSRIATKHTHTNLKVAGRHPRSLICMTLRCLEKRNDLDAKNYLFEALCNQSNNRFLLWILGAQEFDKGTESKLVAASAFKIATNGSYSEGTSNAIAWGALHTYYHVTDNLNGAYVAARKMRKFFSLPVEWDKFLKRWTDTSGEEEVLWNPALIKSNNPMLITAAFFLCLRCYKFCERILQCVEYECDKRGSGNRNYETAVGPYYVWAALYLLKNQPARALEMTDVGIKMFGPSALMSTMRVTCLSNLRGWNSECEKAFQEAERAGATIHTSILYKSALARYKRYPFCSLQRAARLHQEIPSGFTALLIGKIYERVGEYNLAERWCSVAVKAEPLLSDGWAILSILAMYERNLDKARTMLRTAHQVGPISPDIQEDLDKVKNIVKLDQLSDCLVKNMFNQRK